MSDELAEDDSELEAELSSDDDEALLEEALLEESLLEVEDASDEEELPIEELCSELEDEATELDESEEEALDSDEALEESELDDSELAELSDELMLLEEPPVHLPLKHVAPASQHVVPQAN